MLPKTLDHIASWSWEVNSDDDDLTLADACDRLATAAHVLTDEGLCVPRTMKVSWLRAGEGYSGFASLMDIDPAAALTAPDMARDVPIGRPAGLPDAEPQSITLSGPGAWIDAQGREEREHDLVDATVYLAPWFLDITVGVRHSIWRRTDFSGRPHPQVYRRNAPRLARALEGIEKALDLETAPGEPTSYGVPDKYGIT
ncbi:MULTISPECIES: hypothetical protein [Nocardiopsis]|uniref:Uncharacterized protein n=1 Tax=Nocardiopsis lambiniae TaxID=3075539 RepID=A0ABU2M754_9ACTN|nr:MULTISPECIES: hypothetical protein [unclassified Nocardiopsis]MDE3721855.1 hypothetical protein [Nocardiopsis sp. N85]MDT0328477.1 hypothetical protein [Nocardiopsis sp. DSM 44743]